MLPSDFMRAKKLSREFKGTTAPGFGKYRHHMLFSSSEEFRITNPRLKKGIILVEWENTPITGQIQITKKSADYNSTNGLPAGTLLEGAVLKSMTKQAIWWTPSKVTAGALRFPDSFR